MNELRPNFSRNRTLKSEYCVESCGKELDNKHLTWCSTINNKKGIQLYTLTERNP